MTRHDAVVRAEAIPGWMSREELLWLFDNASQFSSALEVGCWKGRSAFVLASGCPGNVYSVDHFRGSPSEVATEHREAASVDLYSEALSNLSGLKNLTIIRAGSLEAAAMFEDLSLDMVFIDGEHTLEAAKADILAWRPKCRKMLSGHDRGWPGVSGALAELGLCFNNGPGSIWYFPTA